ncbi:MAG TPA: cation:proton antiporter regulatory subunit [Acidimicrobiales bacterium]|nr:cation:proton antiporter regulatory subunit [Acidimicrobiales bacterium]
MPDIEETMLPGVGVRHEFTTAAGERVAVLTHRTGRRELAIYDRDDPDTCRTVLHLSSDDTVALSELLAASQVSETVRTAQRLEGVAIDWLTVTDASPVAGRTIGDGAFRTNTGVSVVAVIRADSTIPAPGPQTTLEPGDIAVAVGTPEGLQRLHTLFES